MKALTSMNIVSIVFLILGFEVSSFCYKAGVIKLAANRDHPDTVYVFKAETVDSLLRIISIEQSVPLNDKDLAVKQIANHSSAAKRVVKRVESFPFNPNTISLDDLQRLGFSEAQAQVILNYRAKGGRFRRKSDFAKSFVVADSVYARLEPYIRIPKVDINTADSTIFDELPGIGPYFSSKMVSYRKQLRGYSYPEQLMDIPKFDQERYDKLKDLIICSEAPPYPLWELSEKELYQHPYIRSSAHSIILYKQCYGKDLWTIDGLIANGIILEDYTEKLRKCRIAAP